MADLPAFIYLPDANISINPYAIAYVEWSRWEKGCEIARIHFLVQSTGKGFGQAQTLDIQRESIEYKIFEDCLKGR